MTPDPKSMSTVALLSAVFRSLRRMAQGEIALAQAEVKASLRDMAIGVALLAAAAFLGLVTFGLLMGAAVAALVAQGFTIVQATLTMAAASVVVATLLTVLGRRRLSRTSLTPRRTAENLRRDAIALKEAIANDTAI